MYTKADMDGLKSDLCSFVEDYLACHDEQTAEENWMNFKHCLFSLMEKYIPSRMSTMRYNTSWFNRTLHRMRRKQQRLYNKAKETGNHRLWTKFPEFRKQYNRALRQAHNTHIADIFSADKDDSKKAFFKYVKDLRRDRCGISPLKSGDRIVSDRQGKANVLSDYFKSVFTEEPPKDPPAMNGDSLPTLPPLTFSCDDIQKLLMQLNLNKASGPDIIPIRMLKECAPQDCTPSSSTVYSEFTFWHLTN